MRGAVDFSAVPLLPVPAPPVMRFSSSSRSLSSLACSAASAFRLGSFWRPFSFSASLFLASFFFLLRQLFLFLEFFLGQFLRAFSSSQRLLVGQFLLLFAFALLLGQFAFAFALFLPAACASALPCSFFSRSSAMSGCFGGAGSATFGAAAATRGGGGSGWARVPALRAAAAARRRGGVCTFMSHTSASTATGWLFCQLMPIHRKASSRACTATARPIAGQRFGSGGTR
jgi:hypothetical protein